MEKIRKEMCRGRQRMKVGLRRKEGKRQERGRCLAVARAEKEEWVYSIQKLTWTAGCCTSGQGKRSVGNGQ